MDPAGYSSCSDGKLVQFPPGKFTRGAVDLVGYGPNWKTSPVSHRKVYQRVNGSCWVQFLMFQWKTSPVSPRKVYQRVNGSCWVQFLMFQKENKPSFPQESLPEGQWILLGTVPIGKQVQFPSGKFTRGAVDLVGYGPNWKTSPVSLRKVYQRGSGSCWVRSQLENKSSFPQESLPEGQWILLGTVPIGKQVQFPSGKFTRGAVDLVGYGPNWKTSPVSLRKVYQRGSGSCWVRSQLENKPSFPQESLPDGQWILLGIVPLLRQPAHMVF